MNIATIIGRSFSLLIGGLFADLGESIADSVDRVVHTTGPAVSAASNASTLHKRVELKNNAALP